MDNNLTQNNTAKKQWQKPDFYLLDRNEDVNAKNVIATRESVAPGAPVAPLSSYAS